MPKNTIKILKKLNALGFSEANFSIIHHMPNVTRQQHSSYCETVSSFRAGNNENVRLRLSYILTALDKWNKNESIDDALFKKLTYEAVNEIPFKESDLSSSKENIEQECSKNNTVKKPTINPSATSGIYVAFIHSEKYMPVTRDKRYVDSCARVNNTNVKIGKAKNFQKRYRDYCRDFDEDNVEFIPLAGLDDIDTAEKMILKQLYAFRLRSPKGSLMDWLENIDVKTVIKIIYETLDSEELEYSVLMVPKKMIV